MQSVLFCLLTVCAGALAQIDDSQFSNATFTVTFTPPNTIKITPNIWRSDIGYMSYHCNINKPIAAPTAGDFNSPGLTAAPWAWELSDPKFLAQSTLYYWVRMETNAPKPAPGYNSAMRTATLQ